MNAKVRYLDGLLDYLEHVLLPGLYLNQTSLRHRHIGHLLNRGRRPIIIYLNPVQHIGVGPSRPDRTQFAVKVRHRLIHLILVHL